MPSEILFIPYRSPKSGEPRWDPMTDLPEVEPGATRVHGRLPRVREKTSETVIRITCSRDNTFTEVEYVPPGEKAPIKVMRASEDPPLDIHRGIVVIHGRSYHDSPGTMRITHRGNLEPDQELLEVSDPQPSLRAEAEEPVGA